MQRQVLKSLIRMPATPPPLREAWAKDTDGKPSPWNTHDAERDESYDGLRVEHCS